MSSTPLEKSVPSGRGAAKFTALGYALRVIKALPRPVRERLLDSATGNVTSDLPPFGDTLRLVQAAGGIPNGTRWQERLLASRPDLRGVRTRDVSDDHDGRVRGRIYLPPIGTPAATAAFIWVHGGAFIIGSLDQEEAHWPALELAAAGIPVFSVDYRQALNGLHYPAPQDDVLSAWRWARRNASELGVEQSMLHLGGGSAGGCLVAGAVLRLRDSGEPMPATVYLAYPVLQGNMPQATADMARALSASALPDDAWLNGMFANWAGNAPWDDPYVAPGLADLEGLPPTYVMTCEVDTLRRGSEPYVARLEQAHVPLWHDILPGARHAPFDRPGTPDGEHAIARLRTWVTGSIDAMRS